MYISAKGDCMKKEIIADKSNIAFCGLYCGACNWFLNGKCAGCAKNEKAKWCKTRTCCISNGYSSCADCTEFSNPNDCRKFNTVIGRIIGFVLRSSRIGCLNCIKDIGYDEYAKRMSSEKNYTIKRNSAYSKNS